MPEPLDIYIYMHGKLLARPGSEEALLFTKEAEVMP